MPVRRRAIVKWSEKFFERIFTMNQTFTLIYMCGVITFIICMVRLFIRMVKAVERIGDLVEKYAEKTSGN